MELNTETREYFESVQSIVDDIVNDVKSGDLDPDEYYDRLREQIDGNFWVIYTYQAKLVVAFISENDTAAFDQGMELDHSAGINWSDLAFFAMYQDVCDRMPDLDELLAEYTEILESIARTLFVIAFADACGELSSGDIDHEQAAGAGDDWFDTVTDDTPDEAVTRAREIADDFEKRNGCRLESAGAEWTGFDFHYEKGRTHDLEAFGHGLAMTYIGSGVGLFDGFKGENPKGFECGHSEFHYSEFII